MSSSKFWKSPEFRELEKEWNERLKESGFVDEEVHVDGRRFLRDSAKFQYYLTSKALSFKNTKEEYYDLVAFHFHRELAWEDESDRLIMEKTAEAWPIKKISELLRASGMRKFNRDTIRYIRRRYEHKWGLKVWTPAQMVSRKAKP